MTVSCFYVNMFVSSCTFLNVCALACVRARFRWQLYRQAWRVVQVVQWSIIIRHHMELNKTYNSDRGHCIQSSSPWRHLVLALKHQSSIRADLPETTTICDMWFLNYSHSHDSRTAVIYLIVIKNVIKTSAMNHAWILTALRTSIWPTALYVSINVTNHKILVCV